MRNPQHIFCGEIRKVLSLLAGAMFNKENPLGTGKIGLNSGVVFFSSGLNIVFIFEKLISCTSSKIFLWRLNISF